VGVLGFRLIYVGWIAPRRRMPRTAEIEAGGGCAAGGAEAGGGPGRWEAGFAVR
jgi:hypothetical protein